MIRRTITIATALLLLSLAMTLSPYSIHPARASAYLDPVLAKLSATSPATSTVEVIVVLDHIPTTNDALAIQQYSVVSAPMTELPMILSVTTFGSLGSVLAYSGVVSVWANRQEAYFASSGGTTTHAYGEIPVQHSWWNDIMHVPDVWSLGYQGQGVTVAVVDTGVDATNPSLGYSFPVGISQAPYRVVQNVKVLTIGEIVSNQPLGPDKIYVENQPNTDTTGGHGTSVSGLIAGTGDASNGIYKGAAPQANIVGLGAGDTLFIFHIVASYDYILSHQQQYHIKVINNSWGSDYNCSDLTGNPTNGCDPGTPIQLATKAAHDAGIAVFFAAGNDGPEHPTINPFAEPDWVVAVGAGTQSKGLTEFSSRGVPNDLSKQPDIVTPGINVISTKCTKLSCATDNTLLATTDLGNIPIAYQPYYTTFAGTSAASPMASGVAALVLSAKNLSPDQLKATLMKSTDPMLGYLSYQAGTGYANTLNAVKSALGQRFTRTSITTQNTGTERYTYTQYFGGSFVVTAAWMSASVPVFKGARSITYTATWPTPTTNVLQWEMNIYAANDYAVSDCGRTRSDSDCIFGRTGATSMSYSVTDSTFIASLNNPGFTAGTWDVRVFNFDLGSPVTLTVDVNYAKT